MNTTKRSLFLKPDGGSYLFPFIMVTCLFFLWGFAHSLLDVLNKHFQDAIQISKAMSGLVQFSVYGGYFLMALPAGWIMKKWGFKRGIIFGLLMYALGAFLFLPAAYITPQFGVYVAFGAFLFALFIIACGLTCLGTAANPYVTELGPKDTGERRINLSQSFNAMGWILGPLVGGLLIFGNSSENNLTSVALPYIYVGGMVLLVALLFFKVNLPEIKEAEDPHLSGVQTDTTVDTNKKLFAHKFFVLAVVAQFFYVAGQTGINSFFINYVTENIEGLSDLNASLILSFGGMGLFMVGRLTGSLFMKWFKPNMLLTVFALINVLLMAIVILGLGWFSVIALFSSYFFMSIMFPTIFALGIKGLGPHTKRAASFIVMAIVGGAICPMIMGAIADTFSMSVGFFIPLGCFIFVAFYGLVGYKLK